ncbi:uncharacterized protein [Rutidosis leptorrhynchoides]|uniref:uncharacterized protein n=1 Tax=Rutidosis leptorrhynchoides TaxID=125765 RepID=UPI003A994816
MEEGGGLRTRSFRDEDYNTRRAFLRSYPLFDNDVEEDDQQTQANIGTTRSNKVGASEFVDDEDDKNKRKSMKFKKKKEAMKRIMVTIIEWGGGRVVVLRRFKDKVSFYVVACFPIVFKSPKALITSKP